MLQIKKATRLSKKIKLALIGISGSGKTFSALAIAKGLGQRILVVDTEHGSASAYSDFDFDTIELDSFAPQTFADAIRMGESEGYDVVILDSLSHAWTGKDGAIEQVDKAQRRSQSGNSFTAWKDVTPQHNAMIEAIVGAKCHIIVTLRAKTEYVVEAGKNGKSAPRKVGLAPVQRDGLEYEFDIVANLDQEHFLSITKTRIGALDGAVIEKPGLNFAKVITDWIAGGAVLHPQQIAAPFDDFTEGDIENAAIPAGDVPGWFGKFANALKGTPSESEAKTDILIKQWSKGSALTLTDLLASSPVSTVQSYLEAAQKFGDKKRAEKARADQELAEDLGEAGWAEAAKPSSTPITDAVRAKQVSDPEGEALFDHEAQGVPVADKPAEEGMTDKQFASIMAVARRVFGNQNRDAKLDELVGRKYKVEQWAFGCISRVQSSELLALLKGMESVPDAGLAPEDAQLESAGGGNAES